MSDKPKRRGGAREGAGRKATIKEPVKKIITFEKATIDKVNDLGHNLSSYVRDATDEKLEREQNKDE